MGLIRNTPALQINDKLGKMFLPPNQKKKHRYVYFNDTIIIEHVVAGRPLEPPL